MRFAGFTLPDQSLRDRAVVRFTSGQQNGDQASLIPILKLIDR